MMRLPSLARLLPGLLLALVAGCVSAPHRAEAEIRRKIADIRAAILARSADGIVRDSTPDYRFTGADGVTYDRAGFIVRTQALFARVLAIESLDTVVDRVKGSEDRAEVEITQTMVRSERPGGGGDPVRLWLRYRERHTWVKSEGSWQVQRVEFIGTPERRELPPTVKK